MADWVGSLQRAFGSQVEGDRYLVPGVSTDLTVPPQIFSLVTLPVVSDGSWEATGLSLVPAFPAVDWVGARSEGPSQFWFERVIVFPTTVVLGNIVTTVITEIEIYNSCRDSTRSLTAATNNAGLGVSFRDLPGLPWSIGPQVGLIVQVQVLTDGPPNINGTLDFTLDTGFFQVTITGTRVVMFAFEPEAPIRETLDFLTDVLQSLDGSEQRISVRKHPRQTFDFTLKLTESERRYFHSLIFGFQSGTFGVPVWFESKQLTSDASAGAFTIYLDTRWADFRVDGLAMVWADEDTFDAQEIESMTDSSLTFSSALLHSYDADTALVMPLRLALTQESVGVNRHPMNLDEVAIKFQITDNEANLADVSTFDLHNGLVVLDDPNTVDGTLEDNPVRLLFRLDNSTGSIRQSSDWEGAHYTTVKRFECHTPQALWTVRQLIHALRGSQVGFYLPTFYPDLIITQTLTTGSVLMDIENIGYTGLVRQLEPNTSLWILLTSGVVLIREVVSSVVIDGTTEQLTVDTAWASDIPATSIQCVSFLRLCRIADDRVTLLHRYPGEASVEMAVAAVQT